MRGQGTGAMARRTMLGQRRGDPAGIGAGDLRALERLSDGQLAAVELVTWQGLTAERVAQRIGVEGVVVRRWFRDPVFIAACNELVRAYCSGQLVPLALFRVRQLLTDPRLSLRDAVHAGRFVAELAGLYRTGAPEAGAYAPGPVVSGRSVAEMSAAELARVAAAGQAALARLSAEISDDPLSNPLD